MKIVWSRRALADLRYIRSFIARDKVVAATRVALRIRASAQRLADHAESGRTGRVSGTRELIVSGLPYILPYRIHQGEIQILAVMHGNRQWPESL